MSTPTTTSNSESGVLKTVLTILALIFVVVQVKSCYRDYKIKADKTKPSATARPSATTPTTKVLIPRFDGFTPIEFPINWPFEIETDGDPIVMQFPGVPDPVRYSGKGSMSTPERRSGITKITSCSNKQVRVRIREVKYIH
jgi:hypothetical protein